MKINLNKNQKNKQISLSNLKIQLRNYNGINLRSLAFHVMQNKNKRRIEREKGNEIRAPLRVPKLRSPKLVFFFFCFFLGLFILDLGWAFRLLKPLKHLLK